ncbi:putative non-LTR retroelement reverse transcriptase, partial [Trifolium medium]|nr:putative non-LTR retroelement reverse transcriptase [Trifolium medium]
RVICNGYGGIEAAGEWLGGFSKFIGNGNAYVAELWGLLEGFKIARRLNFRAVELHVDLVVVVQAISSNGHGSHRGSALVQKNKKLLDLEWAVVVRHSYCEANQCADELANIGCSLGNGERFYEICLAHLMNALFVDVMRITT